MPLSEDQLCEIFADGVRDIPALRLWLLGRTKFAGQADQCRLLDGEQMAIRPRRRWWRHWWCYVPELSRESLTKIFMVFEVGTTGERFALHFENKREGSKFRLGQAAAYAPRARHMSLKAEYLSYTNSQTLLLAPADFRRRRAADVDRFDVLLTYDEIARFLPAFGASESD